MLASRWGMPLLALMVSLLLRASLPIAEASGIGVYAAPEQATATPAEPPLAAAQSPKLETTPPIPPESTTASPSEGKSLSASPSPPRPFDAMTADQRFWTAALLVLGVTIISAGIVLVARAAKAGATPHIPTLGPSFFFWLSMVYTGLLLIIAAIYNVRHPEDTTWKWGGVLPIAVPWFGALGAVTISLEGVFLWNSQWDNKYNYWHLARPLFGAVLAIVAFFIFVVLMTASGAPPKILDGPNGTPTPKDFIIFYVVAFLVGYREETFRELIKRATDLILKPGAQPSPAPSVVFSVGGSVVSTVTLTAAAGAASAVTVNVQNNGSVPLMAPMATLSPAAGVPQATLRLAPGTDHVTGGGNLAPGQARSVDIEFAPPLGTAPGTPFTAKLAVTATNLTSPKTIDANATSQ
jgi:hypothetical protein